MNGNGGRSIRLARFFLVADRVEGVFLHFERCLIIANLKRSPFGWFFFFFGIANPGAYLRFLLAAHHFSFAARRRLFFLRLSFGLWILTNEMMEREFNLRKKKSIKVFKCLAYFLCFALLGASHVCLCVFEMQSCIKSLLIFVSLWFYALPFICCCSFFILHLLRNDHFVANKLFRDLLCRICLACGTVWLTQF